MNIIFVTGIGTGIGKTLISAILAEAIEADYWKPVQAGYENGTDSEWVRNNLTNVNSVVHPEIYRLRMAASPHIAAREEGLSITIKKINEGIPVNSRNLNLIVEGAGGLLVPLNEKEFVADLVKTLNATVILVSRNYLGSINHSLLTAHVCKVKGLPIAGWIFNDQYMDYENEIVQWSGIPKIASIPYKEKPDKDFVTKQAKALRDHLKNLLC